jgi:hypothetical protein
VAIGGADHNGDCAVSARFRFTLNAKGVATNNAVAFHDECGGDGTLTGTFKVLTLDPDGSGTARFTCADDCELNFRIQVSPDRATFSLVDVSTPGEFFIGKAVHQ